VNCGLVGVVLSKAKELHVIKTDTTCLKTRKLEKVYNCYEIPMDEKIIAYCKTHPFGITMNGCVFTDKAFYPRPSFLNSTPLSGDLVPARIEYDDFGKYLIVQANEKDSVFMRNKEKNYFICYSSIIERNSTSSAIRKMLIAIQKYVCENNAQCKLILGDIAKECFNRIHSEMKNNVLSEESCYFLKGMIFADYFCSQALDLLFESTYRLCDMKKYTALINKYSSCFNKESYEYYINIPPKFKKGFTEDLSNPNLVFPDDYIYLIRCNLTKLEKTKENRLNYILATIRAGNIIYARQLLVELTEKFGKDSAFIAEDFACVYGNKLMKAAIKSMTVNQEIDEPFYHITDALGLTPLHYAIMLGDKKITDQLLENRKVSKKTEYCQNDKINDLISFTTSAFLQNISFFDSVIPYTFPKMSEFYELRKKLEKQIEQANKMLETLERKSAKFARESNIKFIKDVLQSDFSFDNIPEDEAYYQAERQIRDSAQRLKELRQNTKEKIEEVIKQEREVYSAIVETVSQTVKNLQNDKTPLSDFYIALAENNINNIAFNFKDETVGATVSTDVSEHILLKILEEANNCSNFNVYDYEGFFFMLPEFIKLDMPYRKICITEDGIIDDYISVSHSGISRYPKYGNSWFSKEAHNDIQTLKREYRELAKKYHPDVCTAADASGIFAAIQNEYEKILKSLSC